MRSQFNLPSGQTWVRFLHLIVIKSVFSFLQFSLLCLEYILKFLLWCVGQLRTSLDKTVSILDELVLSGIESGERERIVDLVEREQQAISKEIKPFDFSDFKTYPNKFPHIRLMAKTGGGKTTATEWLLGLLGGEQFVITPIKKPGEWINFPVFGHLFDYGVIAEKFQQIRSLMYKRYQELEEIEPHQINFVLDEWREINRNVREAGDIVRTLLTIARGVRIRLIAIAHGEGTKIWGFEGEKDLAECFTTIRLGIFAKKYCQRLINQHRKSSNEYEYYKEVYEKLEEQGEYCCMVDDELAVIPYITSSSRPLVSGSQADPGAINSNMNLGFSNFKNSNNSTSTTLTKNIPSFGTQGLDQYEQLILEWGQNNPGVVLTARSLQINSRLFKALTPATIRNIFYQLANKNLGAVTGVGQKLGWIYY
ncbi:hypothetical protein NIES267_73470 (plasmid) [Calothrix parasitica NIES-267]|uniref:Uncharacterized protein n=1 Tax=Calothrix parasitica NIES-267 TaxID=1973488 RepID=A0A1Z4M2V3_9CYAN|nr:hypothetical protein NIES267_73470 [Calothrix parasitica NIES-267]